MNPEFPPLEFPEPTIRRRRREKNSFKPTVIPPKVRQEIARQIRSQIDEVNRAARQLSSDQKRAIFLKLTHDRALTKADLVGTGLVPMTHPGANETLVVPRTPAELGKLEARIEQFGKSTDDHPPGESLAKTLKAVRLAQPKDRLSDAFAANYAQHIASQFVIYEIEVVSFAPNAHAAKKEVQEILSEVYQALGHGSKGRVYEHEEFGKGARILLWSTGAMLKVFVEDPSWIRKIVCFDERPKFETYHQTLHNFSIGDIILIPPPSDAETVCVIDTGISALNPFLKPVIRTDISKNFIAGFSALEDAAGHGSGVASLAAYHSLELASGGVNRAEAYVTSARIMADDGQLDVPIELAEGVDRLPDARLLSTLLREIVLHYKTSGVRIFVLSFQVIGHLWCLANKALVPRNAWVARTIDRLSRDHDVVFVTITGNLTAGEISDFHQKEPYPKYFGNPLAKLHDPGQAVLAVTTGSIAHSANVLASSHSALALQNQPSPFTRSGPGFGNAIKPDVVERGGNSVYDHALKKVFGNLGTDVAMASGKLTPALQHDRGTSYAAPRTAYHLARIARDLKALGITASAPLLRAFLVASAKPTDSTAGLSKEEQLGVGGYGLPDGLLATECQNHSVVLFWQGQMKVNRNALFRVHVPIELTESGRGVKRIVVAVASAPRVQAWGVEEYLASRLKFRLFRGDRKFDDIEAFMQLEDGEENKASNTTTATEDMQGFPTITVRSVGALQRATFEWSDHNPEFSSNDYTLGISLTKASWAKEGEEVPMAVVVRIEDTLARCDQLYSRVKSRVQAKAKS